MSRPRLTWGTALATVLAVAMISTAWLRLTLAGADIEVQRVQLGVTPVSVYRPHQLPAEANVPVVIIAHGFAGSQQLMQSFAISVARNGYIAVTFDYLGHGRSLAALPGDITAVDGATHHLLKQTGDVVDYALGLPQTSNEVVVLGHSMASDIVIRFAQSDSRVKATIAVSMFSPAVTAHSPRNLLVVVGDLEGFLKQEALRVLAMANNDEPARAGVTYGEFDDGSARRAVFAEHVEHVGVLYSPTTMRETVAWLDQVYNRQNDIRIDQRGGWIVLLLLGIVLLGWPLSRLLPIVSPVPTGASLPWRLLLPAGLIPMLVTPLSLWWFPADFLSVLVGGYLAVHFGVYGAVTALCLWWLGRRSPGASGRLMPPGTGIKAGLLSALLATVYVAGVMALALDHYVTSFAVTQARAALLIAMLIGTLCYFIADEWLTRGSRSPFGAHTFTHACFLLSLGIAVALSFEDLFFLLIIAAVILIYFVIYGLFSAWIYRRTGHPLVGAVANAVAFAWALAVVFPMLSG